MSASAIEFQDGQKSFGLAFSPGLAFSLGPLSLNVPCASIYALIGPNGAGKSTALNMLMGMGEPNLGSIRMLGRDLRGQEVEIKRRPAYASPGMDYGAWGTVGLPLDFVGSDGGLGAVCRSRGDCKSRKVADLRPHGPAGGAVAAICRAGRARHSLERPGSFRDGSPRRSRTAANRPRCRFPRRARCAA